MPPALVGNDLYFDGQMLTKQKSSQITRLPSVILGENQPIITDLSYLIIVYLQNVTLAYPLFKTASLQIVVFQDARSHCAPLKALFSENALGRKFIFPEVRPIGTTPICQTQWNLCEHISFLRLAKTEKHYQLKKQKIQK